MTGATCPRCHGPLPEAIVRELARGAACPFCSAPLKRPAGRTAIEVSSGKDEGVAALQVSGAPKAAEPAPAATKSPAPPRIPAPGMTAAPALAAAASAPLLPSR